MYSFCILLNMLEKFKNHKYREDLYEAIVLKKCFVIDEQDRKIVNEILLFEINQQYGLI
ncbi:hypothetical protein LCGC14_1216300 [marine sediment metagenome]|uniref:Uncharacterized protein n=1 Tax=marine sediment metagenome TaxID=412755 RepID=A0A0F9LZY7_9ZZZZ